MSRAIYEAAGIKHDNPLKYYKMLDSIDKDAGLCSVFKCERLVDRKKFALKLAEPKTQQDKANVVNEIGIMKLGACANTLKCSQAFFYKNRFWIILELMDSSFTSMLTEMEGSYCEEFCKYALF